MAVQLITPTSHEHWLALRDGCITSTSISALFGLSPYVTRFELYHAHANGIRMPFKGNDRVNKGSRMEAYAAQEVCLKEGWTGEPFKDFAYDADRRIGSSFDWRVNTPDGPALLEIKGVDFFRHRKIWIDDQPPEHIVLQVLWQMELSGIHKAYVAAFTSIYDYQLYPIEYDPKTIKILLDETNWFWDDVDNRREPDPDFTRDEDVISALYKGDGDEVDMSSDAEFSDLVTEWERWKSAEKQASERVSALKAELHFRMGDASAAYTERYRISAKRTKDTPDRVAEPGEIIKGRRGYRRLDVKDLLRQE